MTLTVCPGYGGPSSRRPHLYDPTVIPRATNRFGGETDTELRERLKRVLGSCGYCERDQRVKEGNWRGDGVYGPRLLEVTVPELVAAYRLGGFDAACDLWFGESYRADNFKPIALMDLAYLVGRLPRQFRTRGGDRVHEGYSLPAYGQPWQCVWGDLGAWPEVDLDHVLLGDLFSLT